MFLLMIVLAVILFALVGGLLLWGISAICTFMAALSNSGTSERPAP